MHAKSHDSEGPTRDGGGTPPATIEPSLPEYLVDLDRNGAAGREWLLTNGLGGFAMGSVAGPPTRRYHAMLIGASRPPVGRIAAVKALVEQIVIEPATPRERTLDLTLFRFGGMPPPGEPAALVAFEKGRTCRWHYRLDDSHRHTLTRTLSLERGTNAAVVHHRIQLDVPFRLILRPLVSMLDFHALLRKQDAEDRFIVEPADRGVRIGADGRWTRIVASDGDFHPDPQWWEDFLYAREVERSLDCIEDLFSPGVFVFESDGGPGQIHHRVRMSLSCPGVPDEGTPPAAESARLVALVNAAVGQSRPAGEDRELIGALVDAGDDFVVRTPADDRVSIIAGYPWFADWGRDTMICLPGLLLATGRHEAARRTLARFATHRRHGIIPNRFDDDTGEAHYNTVDASLWFIHAACEWLRATDDLDGFFDELLPACLEVVDAYEHGTDYDIGVDPADGLVFAGDEQTQLTWMERSENGVTFTPRHGKPIEINALWHCALRSLSEILVGHDLARSERLALMAHLAGASIAGAMWNEAQRALYDRLTPDGSVGRGWAPVDEIRPNQLFAVSLPYSPLSPEQQQSVVRVARAELLTPHGVRTLAPSDNAYHGRYRGTLQELDAAYHTGTVWPWLIGPMCEAVLRVGNFSDESKRDVRSMLDPLLRRLGGECPGQLAEVFDGDDERTAPQTPGGCPAQAWSVAEVLRVLLLITR